MSPDLLSILKTIDIAILQEVVRQDLARPFFEITSWSVNRLSDRGIMNPDGLWIFRGEGTDDGGSQSWAVVLKLLKRQDEEPPLDNMWHWQREVFLARSGLIEALTGAVIAPRFYKVEDTPDGAWLWLEYVESTSPEPWGFEEYRFAARQLGIWHGRLASGKTIPLKPWMARQHYRYWYTETNPEVDFQFDLNRKFITGGARKRYERLWTDRQAYYQALEHLPQTFSHFDTQRRNLLIRSGENKPQELVLLDWAQCGWGPMGAELNYLVVMSAGLMDFPIGDLASLEAAAYPSYIQGLVEGGWSGDPDLIRLGYTAWVGVWVALVHPNVTALWCREQSRQTSEQFVGPAGEELFQEWLPLFDYSLDCADEARTLMKKLGYS